MGKLALFGGPKLREKPFPDWPQWGKEEEDLLLQVLRRKKWDIGKRWGVIQEFEKAFAEFHQAPAAVACANCTQALEVMLAVSGIGPGDEVIVPSYTFIATASAVAKVGATPIFADINLQNYVLDVDRLATLITPRTKAIIPVHFSGHFVDMEKLSAMANSRNLLLFEDAAQAHGAKWNGYFPGKKSQAACFSFQYSKNMTAGEGGIIISQDIAYIEACWQYIWHGRKKDGIWYEHFEATSNYRMTEWSAAVLLPQLKHLNQMNEKRMQQADLLLNALKGNDAVIAPVVDARTQMHPWHLFILRLNRKKVSVSKDLFVRAINAEGVNVLPGYAFPLYRTPAFKSGNWGFKDRIQGMRRPNYSEVVLENSEGACRDCFWIFQSNLLGDSEDMVDIANAISKVADNIDELEKHDH